MRLLLMLYMLTSLTFAEELIYIGRIKEISNERLIVDIKTSPESEICYGIQKFYLSENVNVNLKAEDLVAIIVDKNPCKENALIKSIKPLSEVEINEG